MSDLDLSPRQLLVEDASRTIDATVVPLEYRHPILAAEFADAFLHMTAAPFLSPTARLTDYHRTIESVLRSLPEGCPRTVSLSDEGSELTNTLHAWEVSLAERYAEESAVPHARGRQLRRLIRVHSASGGAVCEHASRWAAAPCCAVCDNRHR